MPRYRSLWGLMFMVLLNSGCSRSGNTPAGDEKLNSVLWIQSAPEYSMIAAQSYALAKLQLQHGLMNKDWTAAVEQQSNFADLPPAVILDVDETVLNNTAFEARLIESQEEYNETLWGQWVGEEKAIAVPGALDFVQFALEQGVAVFYVTNRAADLEMATRRNLEAQGFPVETDPDQLLTKNEREGWGSDKITRRQYIASSHRILLLLGDDLNDFVSGVRGVTPQERREVAQSHDSYWGSKWIALPNANYGSWESALYDTDYSLSRQQKIDRKMMQLDTGETR